jgi:hypothetical protein
MDKTLKNEMELIDLRKKLKQLVEEFYVVYKEFLDVGFNEKQALALTIKMWEEVEE